MARRAALFSGAAVAAVLLQTGRAVLRGEHGTPAVDEAKYIVGVDGRLVTYTIDESGTNA